MVEVTSPRKIKILLSDYDYQKDIDNRILMSELSAFDLQVLEEILYSSLQISLPQLAKDLDCSKKEILPIIQKLSEVGLLVLENDTLLIDKQMRKYYEFQIIRYLPHFKPDMEFFQGLLKKVPIHVLPSWYSLSRSTDNIFTAIMEKHLQTPPSFQRYLLEFSHDPILNTLIQSVHTAPDCQVFAEDLQKQLQISKRKFEECVLLLEYGMICCSSYVPIENNWKEIITPFQEWKEYLLFLRKTEPKPITTPIIQKRDTPFAFIEDMVFLLDLAEQKELPSFSKHPPLSLPKLKNRYPKEPFPLLENHLVLAQQKLLQLGLIMESKNSILPTKAAKEWKNLSHDKKALHLYLHSNHRSLIPDHVEKCQREAEKCLKQALTLGWVYFDDFVAGCTVPLQEERSIKLKRSGKSWHYELPHYTEDEKQILKKVLLETLFEVGVTSIGIHNQKDCFCVTPFGRLFFDS